MIYIFYATRARFTEKMVMNQFVTTYRKDYLWPYVRTFGSKPSPEHLYKPQYRDQKSCDCNALPPLHASNEQKQFLGPNATKEEAWSRLGPMGPLLDPKIYPARVGAPPESQISRFNQPNTFLQKLQEKYPFIYECLRNAPPDDLISRINRDRLRTTYEVDYCRMREYPDASYDELLRSAGVSGAPPCPEPVTLPGDPCRPGQRNVAYRPAIISKQGYCKSTGGGSSGFTGEVTEHCIGTCHGPLAATTNGISEYMDNVSKLGGIIMKEKIHYSKERKTT